MFIQNAAPVLKNLPSRSAVSAVTGFSSRAMRSIRVRHVQRGRDRVRCQLERYEKFFPQDFAGMNRRKFPCHLRTPVRWPDSAGLIVDDLHVFGITVTMHLMLRYRYRAQKRDVSIECTGLLFPDRDQRPRRHAVALPKQLDGSGPSYLTVTPAVVRKASLRVVAFKSSRICLVRTVVCPGVLMMAWTACGDEKRLALYSDAGLAYGSRSAASVRAAFCFRLVARKGALSGSAACDQEDDPWIGAGV
jgi:hypothetical protein